MISKRLEEISEGMASPLRRKHGFAGNLSFRKVCLVAENKESYHNFYGICLQPQCDTTKVKTDPKFESASSLNEGHTGMELYKMLLNAKTSSSTSYAK